MSDIVKRLRHERSIMSDFPLLRLEAAARIEALEIRIEELKEVLHELADLMDDVVGGGYKPDSFTTQPAHAALKAEEDE